MKDIKAKHKLSEGSVFTIRSHKFIFRPLFRYLAGDELNSDDDSDEESDDEDDDDDPDNFEDTSESDQQDSKVDSLKSKLYERARAMKQDGQPINLLPRYVHSRQKPLVEQQQQ